MSMKMSNALSEAIMGLRNAVRITVRSGDSAHPFASALSDFATGLQQLDTSKLELHHVSEMDGVPPAYPALSFGRAGGPDVVHYLALPEGPEEAPFIELLKGLGGGGNGVGARTWIKQLADIEEPVELLLFIAPTCPNCPKAVTVALTAALASDVIKASIIDAMRFPDIAERYKVQSVPVTVIDGGLSFVGLVPGQKLVEHLLARGGESHARELFRSLVTTGRHEEAAESLLEPRMRTPFLDWWRESTLTDRISLMLVCEAALELAHDGLDAIVPSLVELTRTDDIPLRGDTADLLGKIGTREAREVLRTLCDDANADVAEIAAEALEELEERGGAR